MTICYFEAFSGISGDMTVGALLDAGADAGALTGALESLETGAAFRIEKTARKGVSASKFSVDFVEQKKHRHLPDIVKMIEGASLSERARTNAMAVFQRLGEAEAKVHGVPIEKVHFHEVGAVDSICDIVGACVGLDLLGVEEVFSSALNVGSGTVQTEHGILPVPAPATAELLAGRPIYARGPALELTTPTGAAIVGTLSKSFGAMPAMSLASLGYGAGDKDFAEHANVLRVLVGTRTDASESTTVTVLEANIDDSSPEVLGFAMERLFGAGALDVTLESVMMKKNRPGTLLRVIARPETQEDLAAIIFAETSTLGLRLYPAERRVKARSWTTVDTSWGPVRIKTAEAGSFAPEYEDCRELALRSGAPLRRIMAEAALAFAQRNR